MAVPLTRRIANHDLKMIFTVHIFTICIIIILYTYIQGHSVIEGHSMLRLERAH